MEDKSNQMNEPAIAYSLRLNPALFQGQLKPKSSHSWPGSFLAMASSTAAGSDFQEIATIREGVPMSSLAFFMQKVNLSLVEMAQILHTTDRTLRRYTSDKKLSAEHSERAIELAKLYARGEEVFGSLEDFKQWVDSPILALGNRKPKEFLDTSIGFGMLMKLLGRIEHGVYS